jgi:hypothetical protein
LCSLQKKKKKKKEKEKEKEKEKRRTTRRNELAFHLHCFMLNL